MVAWVCADLLALVTFLIVVIKHLTTTTQAFIDLQVKEIQSTMVGGVGYDVKGHILSAFTPVVRKQRAVNAGSHSAPFHRFVAWDLSLWNSATIFRVWLPISMNPI